MTQWYRLGSAAVTNGSKIVTGSLTGWQSQVRAGDAVSFDGGSSWYEVGAVTSNTSLTLALDFAGATAANATYQVLPTSPLWSLSTELAAEVRALLAGRTDLLAGEGPPAAVLGGEGSLYIDELNKTYQRKTGGVWGPPVLMGGVPGRAATVAVGTITTGAPGSDVVVTNSGDANDAVLDITIPRGAIGDRGFAGTIEIRAVTTGAAGSSAAVTNSGDENDAVLDITIPRGDRGAAATIAVGTVTTGAAGSGAAVTNSGDANDAILDITIPRGDQGAAATIAVGTVTTGNPGTSVTVENVGTSSAAVLNITIPRGSPGLGSGDVRGPASAVPGRVAVYDDVSGKLLADGGQSIAEIISAAASAAVSAVRNGVEAAYDTLAEIRDWITAHQAAADPHPQYLTPAEGNAAYAAVGAVSAHVAEADPHPQYLTPAEGNAAYAAVGAVSAHVAVADPHVQYHTDARGDARYPLKASPQAYTGQQYFQLATLTDAASITWNGATQQVAKVTLGGARAFAAMTDAVEGAYYELAIHQDATGSRIPTWANSGAGSYDFGTDGAPTLTTTANRADILGFKALTVAGVLKLRFVGIKKGFS